MSLGGHVTGLAPNIVSTSPTSVALPSALKEGEAGVLLPGPTMFWTLAKCHLGKLDGIPKIPSLPWVDGMRFRAMTLRNAPKKPVDVAAYRLTDGKLVPATDRGNEFKPAVEEDPPGGVVKPILVRAFLLAVAGVAFWLVFRRRNESGGRPGKR